MNFTHHQEGFKLPDFSKKLSKEAMYIVEEVIHKNNAVGTIIGYYDESLSIISVSDYLLQELEYTPESFYKITNGSLKNLFLKEGSYFLEDFEKIKGEGEGKILTASGAPVIVHLYKENSTDVDGNPIWIMSTHVNWENENLTLIMEALNSASWYMECDANDTITHVYWSSNFRKLLGYRDILDFPNNLESWSNLLHPEDKIATLNLLHQAIQDHTNQIKYDVEYRLKMLDGNYQWFRAIAEITRRRDGSALRISGAFVNIDENKRNALKASKVDMILRKNQSMEHLVHSVTRIVDHFAICDLEKDHCEYTTITLNAGYPSSGSYKYFTSLVLKNFKTLPPLAPLEYLLSPKGICESLKNEQSVLKFEYCSINEDSFRIANFIPIEWKNGSVSSFLWTSTDITSVKLDEIASRKAMTEAYHSAERANRAKSAFLSSMSHDIRTPMNAIVGMTAIAGANLNNPERIKECLGKITLASKHLLGLINEVLDMARIESGKVTLTEDAFNISELVDNLYSLFKQDLENHHHSFAIHIQNITHEYVYGDNLRLQQIFSNLISNSIKYTPDGGKITFTIEEKENRNSNLALYEFSVEDNGIGMSEEFQKIMFEPFTREEDHRTSKIQGTGLGMSITKNFIDMMNGTVHVESKQNLGTKITVTFLLKKQEKENEKIEALQNLPVLVVDDDMSCCESTVTILNEIGLRGECVTNGEQAIVKALARHKANDDYFAIFIDWKMPTMDGIETTHRIRQCIDEKIPIIILTAYDYHEIEEDARKAGVNAFIEKPLFPSKITSLLQDLINGENNIPPKNSLQSFLKLHYNNKHILLVEDNALNREIAYEILSMIGIQVDVAENGQEACNIIANAKEDAYDLIFMDIQMPIMNGYDATKKIRQMKGKRANLPIIAMSANAFIEDVMMSKKAGMNEHITKPLDFDKLINILKTYLDNF